MNAATVSTSRPDTDKRYTLANAQSYGWSSITGVLNQERVRCLDSHVVGPKVLDAGCGGGAYVNYLAKQGYDVTGIDSHGDFLAVAEREQFLGDYVWADLNDVLPFPDKSFDSAICFDVLEHVNDRAAIQELGRVTKRRLIVAVPHLDTRPNKYALTYYPYLDPTHLRYYTEHSLAQLIVECGANVLDIRRTDRVPVEDICAAEVIPQSRWPGLSLIYQRAWKFLLSRAQLPCWHINLLAAAEFPEDG